MQQAGGYGSLHFAGVTFKDTADSINGRVSKDIYVLPEGGDRRSQRRQRTRLRGKAERRKGRNQPAHWVFRGLCGPPKSISHKVFGLLTYEECAKHRRPKVVLSCRHGHVGRVTTAAQGGYR